MGEKNLVVDTQTISYEGVFKASDVAKTIVGWCLERGYKPEEPYNEEIITADGKQIKVEYKPNRKPSDYGKFELNVELGMNFIDTVVEKDGKRMNLNKGSASVEIKAFLITDYEGRWETAPVYYFLRTIVDKYIYPFYTGKFESILAKDVEELKSRIKANFNMYKLN